MAAMCVVNFFMLPFIRAVDGGGPGMLFLVAPALGLFPAQLGALTLWLVWGPGPLVARLARHWLAALALFTAWAMGAGIALSDGPTGVVPSALGAVLCSLPLVSLAAQLPLWPLRTHAGWRVEQIVESSIRHEPGPPASQPLAIRDILIGTAATAIALAGIRVVAAITDARQAGGQMEPTYWLAWGIAVLLIAALSLTGFLPATWLLLRGAEPAPRLGLWLAYVGVATLAIIVVIGAIAGAGPDAEPLVGLVCVAGGFALALSVPLLLARSQGWRLVLPSDPPSSSPADRLEPRVVPLTERVAPGTSACDIASKEHGA